eukprot:TRINITY_DN4776_c0_g1_i6.p2 TRINITY_DN4776_c0_g1~~TRINITY_DN4776_c0_g1_i6.p2  ORF type:complete len:440 (+),score=114.68 TRINITY_DN4776_c0_g1_i6:82-1401(+)
MSSSSMPSTLRSESMGFIPGANSSTALLLSLQNFETLVPLLTQLSIILRIRWSMSLLYESLAHECMPNQQQWIEKTKLHLQQLDGAFSKHISGLVQHTKFELMIVNRLLACDILVAALQFFQSTLVLTVARKQLDAWLAFSTRAKATGNQAPQSFLQWSKNVVYPFLQVWFQQLSAKLGLFFHVPLVDAEKLVQSEAREATHTFGDTTTLPLRQSPFTDFSQIITAFIERNRVHSVWLMGNHGKDFANCFDQPLSGSGGRSGSSFDEPSCVFVFPSSERAHCPCVVSILDLRQTSLQVLRRRLQSPTPTEAEREMPASVHSVSPRLSTPPPTPPPQPPPQPAYAGDETNGNTKQLLVSIEAFDAPICYYNSTQNPTVTYFLQQVHPAVVLVVVFDQKRGNRDRTAFEFMTSFVALLRMHRLCEAYKKRHRSGRFSFLFE